MIISKIKESIVVSTSRDRKTDSLIREIFSYNKSLKLYHKNVTSEKNHSQHVNVNQTINNLLNMTDRILETSYFSIENLDVNIPNDIIESSNQMYRIINIKRKLFSEPFSKALLDEYQKEIQQLIYHLKKLE